MDRVFSRPEFEGVYWYYSRFSGVKPGRCPGCGQDLQLTKHHVVPKKNGGKGMRQNYFYLCRKCHDWIHDMFSKVSKIIASVLHHSGAHDEIQDHQESGHRRSLPGLLREMRGEVSHPGLEEGESGHGDARLNL